MLLNKVPHSQFQMHNPGRVRENGREASEEERKIYLDRSPTMRKIFSISKINHKKQNKQTNKQCMLLSLSYNEEIQQV